jgi:hypothetical protein
LAQKKVTLNNKANEDNPLFVNAHKGLSHLIVSGGQPVVAVNGDATHVYELPRASLAAGGNRVLMNGEAGNPLGGADHSLKNPAGAAIDNVFDVAVTNKPVEISATRAAAEKNRNTIFVAGSTGRDLTANAPSLGINAVAVQTDHLEALKVIATNGVTPDQNVAKKIYLGNADAGAGPADDKKILAVANPAQFANAGDVNIWWDDRYQRLFGALSG